MVTNYVFYDTTKARQKKILVSRPRPPQFFAKSKFLFYFTFVTDIDI